MPVRRGIALHDGDDDVLSAVDHIGHWCATRPTRKLNFADDLTGQLVVRSEHPTAGFIPELRQRCQPDIGSLIRKHEC